MSAYDSIASLYDSWSSVTVVEDIPFYVSLAREADGPVVELAVGTARVAAAVARETGKRVIGIDSSPAMLDRARATGADLDLRLGEMRELELSSGCACAARGISDCPHTPDPAALVYCPGRSLLHLPTWDDKLGVFRRVHAALRPGGRFAWNAFVFHHHVATRLDGAHEDDPFGHTIRHVPADNRVDITLDAGGEISLWWATKSEWDGLWQTAGFELEALYGDFDRTPFGDDAGEFVYVARRPPAR